MKLLRKTQIVLFALLVVLFASVACWPQTETKPSDSGQSNPAPATTGRVRISAGVAEGNLTHKVLPPYPSYAKANRIQGAVVLRTVIDREGRVIEASKISGHPYLVPTAIDAVKQWRYRPFLLNGNPVEVETPVTVNFNLTNTERQVVAPQSLVH